MNKSLHESQGGNVHHRREDNRPELLANHGNGARQSHQNPGHSGLYHGVDQNDPKGNRLSKPTSKPLPDHSTVLYPHLVGPRKGTPDVVNEWEDREEFERVKVEAPFPTLFPGVIRLVASLDMHLDQARQSEEDAKQALKSMQVEVANFLKKRHPQLDMRQCDPLKIILYEYQDDLDSYARLEQEHNDLIKKEGDLRKELEKTKAEHLETLSDTKSKHEKDLEKQKATEHREYQQWNKLLIVDAHNFQPLTDTHFAASFDALGEKVRDLADKADCEFSIDREQLGTEFSQVVYTRVVPERHLAAVLEMSFWKILSETVFRTPFSVFGKHGESLLVTWCNFFTNSWYTQVMLAFHVTDGK